MEARGRGKDTEAEPYRCWTITQSYWRRLQPEHLEELDQRGPRYGQIAIIVVGASLAVAGLCWLFRWYIAAIGGAIVAVALLLALDKLDELRRRRYWRNWPERWEFVPGSARPAENKLRGCVIEPPGKDDTIEAWERFLTEMRDLPQHYGVVRWAVQNAEAELVRRNQARAPETPWAGEPR